MAVMVPDKTMFNISYSSLCSLHRVANTHSLSLVWSILLAEYIALL